MYYLCAAQTSNTILTEDTIIPACTRLRVRLTSTITTTALHTCTPPRLLSRQLQKPKFSCALHTSSISLGVEGDAKGLLMKLVNETQQFALGNGLLITETYAMQVLAGLSCVAQ